VVWKDEPNDHTFVEPTEAAPYEAVAIATNWVMRRVNGDHDNATLLRVACEAFAAGRKAAFGEAEVIARFFVDVPGIRFPPVPQRMLIADAIAQRAGEGKP
jgi:hypothetical protein